MPRARRPVITVEPVDQTVAAGGIATFTAAATSNVPLTVTWVVRVEGSAATAIDGAYSTTYSFTALASDDGKYDSALFDASWDLTATRTNEARLTVLGPSSVRSLIDIIATTG